MKKIISVLFIFTIIFNTVVAQKLNSKGQQMVSSIKVYNGDSKYVYSFSFYYDSNNRLIKLKNDSNYEIWYENGTLHKKVKDWQNGGWSKYKKYEYTLDKNRNILKKIYKCYDYNMVGYERWDYNFTYGYPASDTIYQVVKSEQNYIPVEVKNGKAIPHYEYIEKTTYHFRFECGNEHMIDYSQRDADGSIHIYNQKWGVFHKYTSYRNMTNLNMNYILNLSYMDREYAECATEWCNHFSFCLPDYTDSDYLVYHFRDKEPYALYMVEHFCRNGKLRYTFIINYVDEK